MSESARLESDGVKPGDGAHGGGLLRCGSLTYTRKGLVVLFCWLLWGDFCFNLMETIVPSIIPLKLQSLGSANWLISLIMTTLPGVFNTTICPWVSFKSDRYRSRWGRRIPFILFTMPFLTASLLLIGFSDSLGDWLHRVFLSGSAISQGAVVIVLLGVFVGMFDLFNMFVGSVYYYLYNDVVPEHYQSRFMGWSRLVGVATSTLYNFFIYKYALSHMREIYIGAALLYFLGFGLMCLKVREGSYPPVEGGSGGGFLADVRVFFRDCFSIPFYWLIFLGNMFAAIGATSGVFNVFLLQSLGLDLDQIGKSAAIAGALVAICLAFAGWLADKWHPVKVEAYVTAFNILPLMMGLLWLFIDPPPGNILFWIIVGGSVFSALLTAVNAVVAMPRIMHLFPREQFGAFCGAQSMVRAAGTMIGGAGVGIFLDLVRRMVPDGGMYFYRYAVVWQIVFALLTFGFCYAVFRRWRRMGGETGYVPPMQGQQAGAVSALSRAERNSRGLMVPVVLAWAGLCLMLASYLAYFVWIVKDPRSAMVCGGFLAAFVVSLWFFRRLMAFMERE